MVLSNAHRSALQALASTSGSLSFVGCVFVLFKLSRQHEAERRGLSTRMVAVLTCLCTVSSFFFMIGDGAANLSGLCQTQAFFIEWFNLATVFWNGAMAFNMYKWIVQRKHPDRIIKKLRNHILFCIGVPFLIAVVVASEHAYGDATLWCWIKKEYASLRFWTFYFFILLFWVYCIVIYIRVSRAIRGRLKFNLGHNRTLSVTHSAVERKLMSYCAVFLITWFFGLLNRTVQYFIGLQLWASVLHVIFVPLQGLMNAIIYGGLFEEDSPLITLLSATWLLNVTQRVFHKRESLDDVPHEAHQQARMKKKSLLSSSEIREGTLEQGTVRMFMSTLNLGESPLKKLGDLTTWIPPGYDLYAIGVQECLCLEELRQTIHDILGGPVEYTMYGNEIGSKNTQLGFHGFIALTVYVKTHLIESGAVCKTETATKEVKKGVNLVVMRAANKGTVGLPFQIYDQSVAFLTAHFASDNKGKSKKEKRNNDARNMLQDMALQPEDVGCDMQFQHDHVFLLGDLNYRMDADPRDILSMIVAAATIEHEVAGNDPNWLVNKYQRENFGNHVVQSGEAPNMNNMVADRWNRLLRFDELRLVMSSNDVFVGFKEMPPYFPPSYRRKKGDIQGDCGDYTDLQKLYAGYTTNVEEDSTTPELKGVRPPSYTDRIIYHSLPDQDHLLQPKSYTLCESIRGSDHRPVSMTCDLVVNRGITLSTVVASIAEKCSVISLKITSLSVEMLEKRKALKQKESFYTPDSINFMDDEDLDGMKMGVNLSDRNHESVEKEASDTNVAKLIVVFPLPCEDPLILNRKVNDVARALGIRSFQDRHLEQLLSESRDLPRHPSAGSQMSLRSEFDWEETQHKQIEVVTVASRYLGMHALLKLTNKSGKSIGQAVISVAQLLSSMHQDGIQLVLSNGGQMTGVLRGMFEATEVRSLADNV